jgi:hypothetical protein
VLAAPQQPGAAVIDRSSSFSPEKVIRVTPNHQRAVERLEQHDRAELYRLLLLGTDLDSKQGSMELLTNELSIIWLIELHSCGERKLDLHEQVCSKTLLWLAIFQGSDIHLPDYHALSHQHATRHC